MEYTTELIRRFDAGDISANSWREGVDRLLLQMAPFAPHLTEELWERTGHSSSIHLELLPQFDENLTTSDMITLAVQVNGKLRDQIKVAADIDQDGAISAVRGSQNVARHMEGMTEVKVIYVPGRLVNIVVKPSK